MTCLPHARDRAVQEAVRPNDFESRDSIPCPFSVSTSPSHFEIFAGWHPFLADSPFSNPNSDVFQYDCIQCGLPEVVLEPLAGSTGHGHGSTLVSRHIGLGFGCRRNKG